MIRKLIVSGIVTIGLLGSCNSQSNNETAAEQTEKSTVAKNVDVNEFKKLVAEGNGVVLDVRTPEEVAEGAIPTSTNIDFYADDFQQKLGELNKDKAVYVYCRSGGRSGKAMEQMKKMGFSEVYNLNGGIGAWNAEGLETEKK